MIKRIVCILMVALLLVGNINVYASNDDFTPHKRKKLNLCPLPKETQHGDYGTPGVFGDIFVEGSEANQVAKEVFDALTLELGMSGEAASGIMANIKYESGFVPDAAEVYDRNNPRQTPITNGVDGVRQGGVYRFGMTNKKPINGMAMYDGNMLGGGGLVQFTPYTRFTESEFWNDSEGWNPKAQMKKIWQEEFANRMMEHFMRNTNPYYGIQSPYKTIEEFITSNDPAKSADTFQVAFERPGEYHPERKDVAQAINNFFNKDNRKANPSKWVFTNGSNSNISDKSSLGYDESKSLECTPVEDIIGELMSPVEDWENHITSPYGNRINPTHPEKGIEFHKGLDISRGITDDPIYAVLEGVVTIAQEDDSGYGRWVEVKHNDRFTTRYAHLNTINVKVGDTVKGGQMVGGMGTTGRSTGTHLHFETIIDGERVDPYKVLKNPKDFNLEVPTQVASGEAFNKLKKMIGGKYVWGGQNPSKREFDCSGLSSWFIKIFKGKQIPRTAQEQESDGGAKQIIRRGGKMDFSKLQPGDLLFFATYGGNEISHVGIYIGNGKMIHASTPETGIVEANLNTTYWTNAFISAVRY